jgi:hypothetical protein
MIVLAVLGLVVLIGGVVLKHVGWGDYEFVIMAGSGLLIIFSVFLYALFPFHAKNDNMSKNMRLEPIWDFSMKVTGWSLAVVLLSVLFLIEGWPGSSTLLLLTGICVVAAGGCWLYYVAQKNQFGNR